MAELTDEDFDGSSGLVHTSTSAIEGGMSLRVQGVGTYVTSPFKPSPWMHISFDGGHTVFSTKEGKRGKPLKFFVQREGETKVELTEDEWKRQAGVT